MSWKISSCRRQSAAIRVLISVGNESIDALGAVGGGGRRAGESAKSLARVGLKDWSRTPLFRTTRTERAFWRELLNVALL